MMGWLSVIRAIFGETKQSADLVDNSEQQLIYGQSQDFSGHHRTEHTCTLHPGLFMTSQDTTHMYAASRTVHDVTGHNTHVCCIQDCSWHHWTQHTCMLHPGLFMTSQDTTHMYAASRTVHDNTGHNTHVCCIQDCSWHHRTQHTCMQHPGLFMTSQDTTHMYAASRTVHDITWHNTHVCCIQVCSWHHWTQHTCMLHPHMVQTNSPIQLLSRFDHLQTKKYWKKKLKSRYTNNQNKQVIISVRRVVNNKEKPSKHRAKCVNSNKNSKWKVTKYR